MKRMLMVLAGSLIAFAGTVTAKPGAGVALTYAQVSPLTAGQQTDIVVTLSPSSEVTSMNVEFRGSSGLTILTGQTFSTTSPQFTQHQLRVSAAANGRYYLTATIRTDAKVRVVAVPVVVGNVPAAIAPAEQESKISSLPAEE